MSAPTPAPGDDRPREGYYPDPSIPGYVRYWNGASWVPGTSRPAPRDGETLAPPPGAGAVPAAPSAVTGPVAAVPPASGPTASPAPAAPPGAAPAGTGPALPGPSPSGRPAPAVPSPAVPVPDVPSVEETGPHFFDEDPDPSPPLALPAPHGHHPGPASSWTTGPRPSPEQHVAWPEPRGADPRVPHAAAGGAHDGAGLAAAVPGGALPGGAAGAGVPAGAVTGAAVTGAAVTGGEGPGAAAVFASGGAGAPGEGAPVADAGTIALRPSAPRPAPSPPAAPSGPQRAPAEPVPPSPAVPRQGPAPVPVRQGPAEDPAPSPPVPPATVPAPFAPGTGAAPPSWAQQVQRLAGAGAQDPTAAPWKPPVEDVFQAAARQRAAARPAGLGRRLAARLIDTVVVAGVTAAAAVPLGHRAAEHIDGKIEAARLAGETVTVWLLDGTTAGYLGIVLAVLLLFGVLYEALPTARWGATPGKRLLGLRVRDIEEHEPPGFGAALRRWLVYSVSGLLAVGLVGVVWCLFDRPWRQCWHDKAAHTFVAG
ncbi:RDD family protein [Streptomyces sp. NPDC052077]|uniref:RDD family protein n=1 Tax=Streptomyces sp. NPDC052077 TaxID=3154757 RepID=UPI003429B4FA